MFLRIWFGYKYLTTAVVYLVENIEKDVSMNEIYDVLNKKHNVKRTKAERDMRYIILTYDITTNLSKITNKSFIYDVAQTIYEKYKCKNQEG